MQSGIVTILILTMILSTTSLVIRDIIGDCDIVHMSCSGDDVMCCGKGLIDCSGGQWWYEPCGPKTHCIISSEGGPGCKPDSR